MFELTVTVKGTEGSYKQKHMVYERCDFSMDDPVIKQYINETLEMTKIEPEYVQIQGKERRQ